jgi:hypothetical protein
MFCGSDQGSFVDWAKTHEGVIEAMNRILAHKNPASLNIHPSFRDINLIRF